MFKQTTKDTINGWGQVLRFITPILVTITIYILTGMKTDIKALEVYFTNHLSDHKSIELIIERRLTSIETKLNK